MRGCTFWVVALLVILWVTHRDPTIISDLRNWIDEILLWIEKLDLQSWKLT
jgi:hypothetical protein